MSRSFAVGMGFLYHKICGVTGEEKPPCSCGLLMVSPKSYCLKVKTHLGLSKSG